MKRFLGDAKDTEVGEKSEEVITSFYRLFGLSFLKPEPSEYDDRFTF